MRKQKDRCVVADASGDKDGFTAASIKLRRQKDIYKEFCEAAGSYTEYERTFVTQYDRHLSGKTGAVTRKQRAFERAQIKLDDIADGKPLDKSGGSAVSVPINSLTNAVNGGTINKNSEFYERLRNGLINTTIDEDAQKNHILSKAWINQVKQAINSINSTNGKKLTPKSRLFKRYDPQLLVDAYSGKGRLVYNKTNGYNEFVTMPFSVGVTFDKKTGKYVKTNVIQIKYTSNGVHIFPTKEMS